MADKCEKISLFIGNSGCKSVNQRCFGTIKTCVMIGVSQVLKSLETCSRAFNCKVKLELTKKLYQEMSF